VAQRAADLGSLSPERDQRAEAAVKQQVWTNLTYAIRVAVALGEYT